MFSGWMQHYFPKELVWVSPTFSSKKCLSLEKIVKLHLQSEDALISSLNLTTPSDIPIQGVAFFTHHTKQVPSQAEVERDHFPPQEIQLSGLSCSLLMCTWEGQMQPGCFKENFSLKRKNSRKRYTYPIYWCKLVQFELSPFSGSSLELILRLRPCPILQLARNNKKSWQTLPKVNSNIFCDHDLSPALLFSFLLWTPAAQSDICNQAVHQVWTGNSQENQQFHISQDSKPHHINE